MPTTPNYDFPYPSGSQAPNVPLDLEELAGAVDTSLKAVETATDGRLDVLETGAGRYAAREAAGFTTLVFSAGMNYDGNSISFPTGRFSTVPGVQVTIQDADSGSQNIVVRAHSVTASGCTIGGYTGDFPAAVNVACNVKVHWHAIQMTNSTASG